MVNGGGFDWNLEGGRDILTVEICFRRRFVGPRNIYIELIGVNIGVGCSVLVAGLWVVKDEGYPVGQLDCATWGIIGANCRRYKVKAAKA